MERSEILLYNNGSHKEYVSVIFAEDNFWLSQNGMAELFGCTQENIIQHLKKYIHRGRTDIRDNC